MDRRQGSDDDQGVEGDQEVGARGEQDGQPAVGGITTTVCLRVSWDCM